MPEFSYQSTNSDGDMVAGRISADSVARAVAELEHRGLSVELISLLSLVRDHDSSRVEPDWDRSSSAAGPLERHFEAALDRREPLISALSAFAAEMPIGPARHELWELVGVLRQSKTAAALRSNPLVIKWLPVLVAGVVSEGGGRRLSDLFGATTKATEIRNQRRRLFAYPLAVLGIALIVFVAICWLIVPAFEDMFREFGLILPAPTRFVILVAEQIREHGIRLVVISLVLAGAAYGLMRIWLQFALTTRVFGILVSGNSANVNAMSSFTGQLAELLGIGVSLPDALWLAGQRCGHYHFKRVAESLARHAHRGTSTLDRSPVAHNLPANVLHALGAGPGGGPSLPLLRELSVIYSDRVRQRTNWITGSVAPLAILAVGIVVGLVVLSLLSPLLSLVTGLS